MSEELPIIMSGPMVRALLADQKHCTRRVMKPQPEKGATITSHNHIAYRTLVKMQGLGTFFEPIYPRYQVGDHVYVREAWATPSSVDHLSPSQIENLCREAGYKTGPCGDIWYRADNKHRRWGDKTEQRGKWRPSIHMPKWATRIWRRITDVRAERVQDITLVEIIKEGLATTLREHDAGGHLYTQWIDLWNGMHATPKPKKSGGAITHYESYPWSEDTRDPRETISGKPHVCYPNPYVWRYGLGKCER